MSSENNTNRQWLLKTRPIGMVSKDNFELAENPIPEPADGEVLAKMLYLSFEPAMRGWMDDIKSYMPPVEIGEPMRAPGLAEVIESKHPDIQAGDLVNGLLSWSEYITGADFRKIDKDIPPEMLLGPLGVTGVTAHLALLKEGQPKQGETVLVSGAAGATGSIAAQIAKIKSCKTIGIAGGAEKCSWLENEAKLDAAIDYKNSSVEQELDKLCPEGIDIYFDTVGGSPLLESVIERLNPGGRAVLCGMISIHNAAKPEPGPNNLSQLIRKGTSLRGFSLFQHLGETEAATKELSKWIKEGKIVFRTDVQEGFLNIPETFFRLYSGENQGKQLLKL